MLVLFFGCNGQPGHYLIDNTGRTLREEECRKLQVPSDRHLDGTPLFLPRPERVGTGALTYLPVTDRTILAWWGSPFDKRGAVNNAIITDGRCTEEEIWARFIAAFPGLAVKLKAPQVLTAWSDNPC